jgi:hypothetical protein
VAASINIGVLLRLVQKQVMKLGAAVEEASNGGSSNLIHGAAL